MSNRSQVPRAKRKGVTSMSERSQVPRACNQCESKTTTSNPTPKQTSSAQHSSDAPSGGCVTGVMQCFNKDCTVKGHYHKVVRPPLTEAARRLKEQQDAKKDARKK
jgi:hypothetical protein